MKKIKEKDKQHYLSPPSSTLTTAGIITISISITISRSISISISK